MDIEQLNNDYGIEGQLKFVKGSGGFPFIEISNRKATALISVYAAQVLSYRPTEKDEDLLFLSSKSYYDDGKAIRGGIPVCWPWFGANDAGLDRPSHGFVRNGLWTVAKTVTTAFETKVTLSFPENVHSETCWRQAFALELEISVGDSLTLELITRNTGNQSFSITQAFHTYLHVGNINQVRILGLEGAVYVDKLDADTHKRQAGALTVWEEVDRIYTDVKNELIVVDDAAFKRRIKIAAVASKSAVVWNPWTKRSAELADLNNDDYRHFICVETGNIAGNSVKLTPGSEYRLLTNFKIIRD